MAWTDGIITTRRAKGGSPGQRHPGTRVDEYRCSLPGLAGFLIQRCEGTDRDCP